MKIVKTMKKCRIMKTKYENNHELILKNKFIKKSCKSLKFYENHRKYMKLLKRITNNENPFKKHRNVLIPIEIA